MGKALSFLDVSELAQARQIKADLGIKLKVGPEELGQGLPHPVGAPRPAGVQRNQCAPSQPPECPLL